MADLITELDRLIVDLGLAVMAVQVTPAGDGPDVDVGREEMPLTAFVRAAHQAGARILYRITREFDLEEFSASLPDDGDEEARAARARLLRQARRHKGEVTEVEVAFACDGVLHRWSTTPSWYDRLRDDADTARASAHGERNDPVDRGEREALVQRLAAELAAMPAFRRRGSTEHGARAAAYEHAEMIPLLDRPDADWTADGILRRARTRVDTETERRYEALTARLPELAEELAADERFLAFTRVADRRDHASEFLAERNDGYRPPVRIRDRLMNTPPLLGGKPTQRPASLYDGLPASPTTS